MNLKDQYKTQIELLNTVMAEIELYDEKVPLGVLYKLVEIQSEYIDFLENRQNE